MPVTDTVWCPICGRNDAQRVGQIDGRDMAVYSCPRCGKFGIDPMAASEIGNAWDSRRYLLSSATRRASDGGRILQIESSDLEPLAASANPSGSLTDGVDRLLLFLANRAGNYWSPAPVNKETDYPLIAANGEREMNFLLTTAGELGYFDIHKQQITIDGWRRIDDLRRAQPDSRQAFVAMWFDKSLDDAWINGFVPGVEVHGYFKATRVDSVEHNQKIDDRIIAEIRRSGLVVADFTGERGGVYFEAGYALGMGINVIWTVRADFVSKLHFDTRQYNHIVWEEPIDLREKLANRIAATVLPRPGAV